MVTGSRSTCPQLIPIGPSLSSARRSLRSPRSSTTHRFSSDRGCSGLRARRRGSRSRTSGCRPSCGYNWRRSRSSRARIVQAGDEERRRLERNLHDGAQQRLLGLGLALQLAREQLGTGANGAAELLTEAEDELRIALDELRELARGIHPAILTDLGLAAAVRSLAERSAVPVTILALPEECIGEPVEAAAYFLVSEALANVAKYAKASIVRVGITRGNAIVVVDVEDDGVGGADPAQGSGLRGLVDRIQALDGRLRIDSAPGEGTRIHAEIPCAS